MKYTWTRSCVNTVERIWYDNICIYSRADSKDSWTLPDKAENTITLDHYYFSIKREYDELEDLWLDLL